MNTARNLKMLDANILQISDIAISVWLDELDNPFAYSFLDGSSIVNIPNKGYLSCSTNALQRWCTNGRIDKLLIKFS